MPLTVARSMVRGTRGPSGRGGRGVLGAASGTHRGNSVSAIGGQRLGHSSQWCRRPPSVSFWRSAWLASSHRGRLS
eukprot:8137190-Alexandrium_andersonii.AAC.1